MRGRTPGQRRSRISRAWSSRWRAQATGWAFILPALALVAGLTLYPLGFGAVISAFDYDLVSRSAYFVGWGNYLDLLNGAFLHSALITLGYAVAAVTCELLLGVALAMLLAAARLRRVRPAILAVILLPLLMAPVVSGATFKLLLNPEFGLVSHWLGGLDILGNRHLALLGLIGMDIWIWTPFVVLLVTAALAGLPEHVLEAAALDGAGPWQRFRYVILPLIRPLLTIIILFRLMDAAKVVDIPYIMTQGGPGDATDLLSLHIFRTSFSTFDIGSGAAMSVVLVLLLMLPVLALYRAIARPAAGG
jgi:multiple sugar transport system permease protein